MLKGLGRVLEPELPILKRSAILRSWFPVGGNLGAKYISRIQDGLFAIGK
jgi:hypothetical protein